MSSSPTTTAGADRGNSHKITKELASYDADARAVLDYLADHPSCTGKLGSIGICIGGHLSFRAAFNPDVRAAACFYATDIHKRSLGKGMNDDSLDRVGEIRGELLMIWGRQDPHVPRDGRERIHTALEDAGTRFSWVEVNGQHAFARDEGHRYDPELARQCLGYVLDLFHRRLGQGDEEMATDRASRSRHVTERIPLISGCATPSTALRTAYGAACRPKAVSRLLAKRHAHCVLLGTALSARSLSRASPVLDGGR